MRGSTRIALAVAVLAMVAMVAVMAHFVDSTLERGTQCVPGLISTDDIPAGSPCACRSDCGGR